MSGEKREEVALLSPPMIFIIVILILSLDRLTKIIVTHKLLLNNSFALIKDVFHFTLIHNKGAAFGILKNQVPLFIFTSLLAIFLIYFELRNNKHRKLYSIALSFILAGALGNLIDRLFYGYVIDFLDFRVWPVFNIADCAITIGAILLGLSILKSRGEKCIPSSAK